MPYGKIYKLIIAVFMQSILTFNLYKDIEQFTKLLLVNQKAQKQFNLGDYKAYINNTRETIIFTSEKKSSINIVSP